MIAFPLRYLVFLACLQVFVASATLAADTPSAHNHETETIWTCSMHPQIQLPESGQCPICFMDLIEVKKEKSANRKSLRQISFDHRARKLAEVEVQAVHRGAAISEIRMVGKVDYDETRLGTITSWVNGRIDKLFVDYTGSRVKRGQAMVKIYSPELLTAQAELIQAWASFKRSEQSGNEFIRKTAERTLEASRDKLRLLGLGNKQLRAIEKQGKPTEHIVLTAPLSGIVIEKAVNEGMYVKTGSPIYTLVDLDKVWVVLEAYESDLHAIALGQQVRFSVESYPGKAFQGVVAYIDPLVNDATRTIRVRLNVDNRDAKLKPGMFVRATASMTSPAAPSDAHLLVPATAVLVTGKRALVYVQEPEEPGVYTGRELVLGARLGEFYQVKSGLKEGELVVTQGNFRIDSAIQLQGRPSMMNPYFGEAGDVEGVYPSLFVSRLILLNIAFAELSKDIHQPTSKGHLTSIELFKNSLAAVQADGLEHDDLLAWKELSMLLGSDTVLLSEAETATETEQLYTTLSEHFHQLRNRFNLDDVNAARLGTPELEAAINTMLDSYLSLQKNLAVDDLASAMKMAVVLLPLTEKVTALFQENGGELAARLAGRITESMVLLMGTDSLEGMRESFYPLSKVFIQVVESFGGDTATPIFVQYCPMAFGNTGATWLAASEEINNPYFGAMMLRCGEVKKQVSQ